MCIRDSKAEPRIVKRAVACLEKLRTPAGSYVYSLSTSFYPGRPINRHTCLLYTSRCV